MVRPGTSNRAGPLNGFVLHELSGAHPLPHSQPQRACNEEPDCHNRHAHGTTGGLAGEGQSLFPRGALDLVRDQANDQDQAKRNSPGAMPGASRSDPATTHTANESNRVARRTRLE